MEGPVSLAARNIIDKANSIGEMLKQNRENALDWTLDEYLMKLLKKKGLRRSHVVAATRLEKSYVYQIFNGERRPSRDKLLILAFGMKLNEEETQRMLKLGGCSELYPRVERDAIILFAIQRGMNLDTIDEELYNRGFPTLRDPE